MSKIGHTKNIDILLTSCKQREPFMLVVVQILKILGKAHALYCLHTSAPTINAESFTASQILKSYFTQHMFHSVPTEN